MEELIARIDCALEVGTGVVTAIPAGAWGGPTPCAGWDVRTELNHLVGGMRVFAAELTGTDAGGAHEDDWLAGDPAGAYAAAATADRDAWHRPDAATRTVRLGFGAMRAPAAATVHLTELVTHVTDLAVATGPELPAPAHTRLLAYLGRPTT